MRGISAGKKSGSWQRYRQLTHKYGGEDTSKMVRWYVALGWKGRASEDWCVALEGEPGRQFEGWRG